MYIRLGNLVLSIPKRCIGITGKGHGGISGRDTILEVILLRLGKARMEVPKLLQLGRHRRRRLDALKSRIVPCIDHALAVWVAIAFGASAVGKCCFPCFWD